VYIYNLFTLDNCHFGESISFVYYAAYSNHS